MSAPRPILIAGAGIGGLTFAISLARKGVPALVVERAPRLDEVGAGIQISPNASRVLDRLGLGPDLDEAGIQPKAIRIVDGKSGAPLAQIPLGFAAERRWGAPYRMIHRAALQRILANAAADAGVEIRLGTELVDFAETAKGVVIAHLRTRAGDDAISAPALIGADGVRSVVRTRMGGEALRFSGQVAWRATVAVPAHSETGVWLGPGAHLVTYPLDRAGTLNLVAVTKGSTPGDGWALPGDRDVLMRAFRGWALPVQNLLASAEIWMTWPLYEGNAARGSGAVTLLGDAAHPVLPHLAQGAAMAIEDAAVLAARLKEMPGEPARAFRAYETARAARTAAVQTAARRNGDIFRLSGPAAFARDAALRILGPQRLTARFDWVYGYRAE